MMRFISVDELDYLVLRIENPASRPNTVSKEKSLKGEHHPNAAEEGETANIKQNTTNKGFFRGRGYEK